MPVSRSIRAAAWTIPLAALALLSCAPVRNAPAPVKDANPSECPADPTGRTRLVRLDNGLAVLVRPVQGARQTALVVLFAVGGDHDPPGGSGTAHLLEHLLVTCAAGSRPVRPVEQLVQEYAPPDAWNAQTGDRYTVVAAVFPSGRLERELADAAARLSALRVTDSDLGREVPRVTEEVGNMFSGPPALSGMNRAREAARPTPSGGRKGGRPEHLARMKAAALRERWRRLYRPPNVLVVLAGGFDTGRAAAAIHRLLGPIPAGDPADAPAAPGAVRTRLERFQAAVQPGMRPEVFAAAVPPGPSDPGFAAFLVAAARVQRDFRTSGPGMRFPPAIYHPVLDDPHLFAAADQIRQGETPEAAAARLRSSVRDLARTARPEDRSQARMQYGLLLGLADLPEASLGQNVYGLAFGLGRRHQLGIDCLALRSALDRLEPGDIQNAADRYLAEGRFGSAVGLPAAPE